MNRLERPRAVQRRKDPLPTGGSPTMANPDSNRGHHDFQGVAVSRDGSRSSTSFSCTGRALRASSFSSDTQTR
jgi:hypothetical protein